MIKAAKKKGGNNLRYPKTGLPKLPKGVLLNPRPRTRRGKSTGMGIIKYWVYLFQWNEREYARQEAGLTGLILTDKKIAEYVAREFPPRSTSQAAFKKHVRRMETRVQDMRRAYNAGKLFYGVKPPRNLLSHRYDETGNRVKIKRGRPPLSSVAQPSTS